MVLGHEGDLIASADLRVLLASTVKRIAVKTTSESYYIYLTIRIDVNVCDNEKYLTEISLV